MLCTHPAPLSCSLLQGHPDPYPTTGLVFSSSSWSCGASAGWKGHQKQLSVQAAGDSGVVPEWRSGTAGWIRSCWREAEIVGTAAPAPTWLAGACMGVLERGSGSEGSHTAASQHSARVPFPEQRQPEPCRGDKEGTHATSVPLQAAAACSGAVSAATTRSLR